MIPASMMRLALILAAVAILGSAEPFTCPDGYTLMVEATGQRCVKPLNLWLKGTLDSLLPSMMAQCEKDGAHLPIIKSAQDNAMFNAIVKDFDEIKDKSVFLVLGMNCNPQTRRLEWEDHSAITFIQQPPAPNLNFDCVEDQKHVVLRPWFNDWFVVPDDATLYTYTFMCEVKPVDEAAKCGNYDLIPDSADADKPCYKVYAAPLFWQYAQEQCAYDKGALVTINSADENNFFRRSAVSANLLNGVHIGAHQSEDDPSKWTWIDGEKLIDGKTYSNFINPFPVAGGGECVGMQTGATSALWINEDCKTSKLPYICRRKANV